MRTFFLSLILVFNLLPAFAQSVIHQTDFFFTLNDNVNLDCSEFQPDNIDANKSPAVIFCHGFGGSKDDVKSYAEALAKKGCITFIYSMRGQGRSTGYSNLMSRTEMKDLIELVNFIKTKSYVDPSNIGILGSSQGGIIPFMAACYGENFRFLVCDLASPEFASSWIENGCVKMTLLWSLSYDSTKVRYCNEVKNYRKWILSKRKDYWDSLAYYLPKNRDFADKVHQLNSPILLSNSWQDKFFNSQGMIKALESINDPYRAYFGVVQGHGSDTISSESIFHSRNIDSWINQWLFGKDPDEFNQFKIIYASSTNPVNFHHWNYIQSTSFTWPPNNVSGKRFYFQTGKKLNTDIDRTVNDTISLLNDVRDKKLKMQDAINRGFGSEEFKNKFVKTYLYFESEPLQSELKFTGCPIVNLFYSSDADICQFNFQIWEAEENGNMNFVTRINYTDRHYAAGSVRERYIQGTAHSHIFSKGSRIRVYLTNIDNGPYDSFLGDNPYVLPILKQARNVVYMNGDKASYIELPEER